MPLCTTCMLARRSNHSGIWLEEVTGRSGSPAARTTARASCQRAERAATSPSAHRRAQPSQVGKQRVVVNDIESAAQHLLPRPIESVTLVIFQLRRTAPFGPGQHILVRTAANGHMMVHGMASPAANSATSWPECANPRHRDAQCASIPPWNGSATAKRICPITATRSAWVFAPACPIGWLCRSVISVSVAISGLAVIGRSNPDPTGTRGEGSDRSAMIRSP